MDGERAPTIGELLERVTYDADTYGGKSIIRGRRLAVEHVLVHLAVGDSPDACWIGVPGWRARMFCPASPMLVAPW